MDVLPTSGDRGGALVCIVFRADGDKYELEPGANDWRRWQAAVEAELRSLTFRPRPDQLDAGQK